MSEQELERRKQRELRGFAVGTVVVATMLGSLVLAGMVGAQGAPNGGDVAVVPVLVEGFVMVPADATSVTIMGNEAATPGVEIATSPVLDLSANGTPCVPPPAIAYRMFVTEPDTGVAWQVAGGSEDTGGDFTEVPNNFLSADSSPTNEKWCSKQLTAG